jgi:hypothetical protein
MFLRDYCECRANPPQSRQKSIQSIATGSAGCMVGLTIPNEALVGASRGGVGKALIQVEGGWGMGFWRGALAAGLLGAMLVVAEPAWADTLTYKISLSPTAEVPPVRTGATGSADVAYDTDSRVLTWTITHTGLSGAATAAHFHGPATTLENAPVIILFNGSLASPIKGSATLTAAQATQFLGGSWYINIHTPAYPGGELRGQVPKHK